MNHPGLQALSGRLSHLKDNPKAVMSLVVAFLILDALFVLRWQFSLTARSFKKANQLTTDIKTTRNDSQMMTSFQTRLNELKDESARLNKMIIVPEDLPAVLETISKFADISVVTLLKIKPTVKAQPEGAALKGDPGYMRQEISVIARCGFHQLGRFVALLESAPVFIDIKSIEILSGSQEATAHSVTITLEVVVKKV